MKHPQKISFHKYHGSGNDFVMIDNRDSVFKAGTSLIERICHRHMGIGADGLILLENDDKHDFRMHYFNSDGREASMCGNGGRCIIAFAKMLGIGKKQLHYRFMAVDGLHEGVLLATDGNQFRIRLKMADTKMPEKRESDFLTDTGSPHLLRFTESMPKDFINQARAIRFNEAFRENGINVNFIEEYNKKLKIRTYERGVENETLSCGTGTTAAVLTYAMRNGISTGEITVQSRGGLLKVAFRFDEKTKMYRDIWLEGPVVNVFHGVYMDQL